MQDRYFLRIDDRIEREYFSERTRFDAYVVQERRLTEGAILSVEAFDLTDHGWMRVHAERPVTILTTGVPDDYGDR
jgi:hypothetical protein